jgi:hypothetical protein
MVHPLNRKLNNKLYILKVQNRTNPVSVLCLVSAEEFLLAVKEVVEAVAVQWPLGAVMEVVAADERLSGMAAAAEQFSSDTGSYWLGQIAQALEVVPLVVVEFEGKQPHPSPRQFRHGD